MARPGHCAVRIDAGDQPQKIIFACAGAIARRRVCASVRMGMITADEFATRAAQGPYQAKMVGGIELETIRLVREIASGMDGRYAHRAAIALPLDQPTALAWKCGASLNRNSVAQRGRQDEDETRLASPLVMARHGGPPR